MKKVLRRKINVCTYIFNCAVERRFYRIYLGITFIYDATHAVNAMLLICPKNETGPLHLNHIAMKNKEQKTQTEASAMTQAQTIQAECNKEINILGLGLLTRSGRRRNWQSHKDWFCFWQCE